MGQSKCPIEKKTLGRQPIYRIGEEKKIKAMGQRCGKNKTN